ncbi:hypothetical protein ATANTOWER_021554 [Ataeniobius toweri]|uniref:Uncharacterized protein n=1 Tax=Ataeniobius toweri TaxID=208326 RepID=A0ABU7C2T4_9TELE|nr:hypothetical protein [Ataeniobius toweri]
MDSGLSLFYPLAAGSDVCFIAPGEPCPPSSEPLRTTLLQRCSVAHSPSRIITSLPGGPNSTGLAQHPRFPVPGSANKTSETLLCLVVFFCMWVKLAINTMTEREWFISILKSPILTLHSNQ